MKNQKPKKSTFAALSNTNIRSSFFSQRIVNHWNGLPEEVVRAESVNTFKNRLDKWKEGEG